MALRNLLLVSYQFPPIGGSGVQRALKLARYLPRAGWRAHVISAGHTHYPLLDPSLTCGDGDDIVVHRTCGLEPAGMARAICRHLAQDGSVPWWLSAFEDRLYWRLDRVCGGLSLPEAEMLWVPAAIRQARRLVERHDIEAVITSSPPHSTHLVGMNLKRRLGLPWIADLRDPILDNFSYRPSGRLADRFWRWLERSVVHQADRVVVTCPELAQRLSSRYADVKPGRFVTITNGYDPADAAGGRLKTSDRRYSDREGTGGIPDGQRPLESPRGRFVLAYIGAFYREQTIEPVLQAIRELRARRADIATDLEFRMIGSISAAQRRLLTTEDSAFIVDLGYRSHEEAVAEMPRADVLLLMVPTNDGGRLCIPAKVFEYLAFGGHILGLVPDDTYLHRLLVEAGNTTPVDCRKPSGFAPAIERCYDAWRAGTLNVPRNERVVQEFRRDRLAERYAEVVEDCVDGAAERLAEDSPLRVVREEAAAEEALA